MSENDRRVRRTRSALHRALIELMLERGHDRITVRDILDRADVGRSTFYAHFRDKDNLLQVGGAEFLRSAVVNHGADPLRMLFQMADGHQALYQALVGRKASAVVIRSSQAVFSELLTGRGLDRATVTCVSWGIVGLLGDVADGRITAAEALGVIDQMSQYR